MKCGSNVYQYQNPTSYLKDVLNEKKLRNGSFSLRSWAKHLGFGSSAPLSLVLSGQRTIPKEKVPKIAKSLGLDAKQSLYFETLVDLSRSKTLETKCYYRARLEALLERPVQIIDIEHFRLIKDPLHMFILALSQIRNFKIDPEWIQKHLRVKADRLRIKEAVERLIRLKLLEKKDGFYRMTTPYLTSQSDVPDSSIQEYHRSVMKYAELALETVEVSERDFQAYAIAVQSEKLPTLKERLRSFLKDFANEFETNQKNVNQVYQLNIQLFPISKEI